MNKKNQTTITDDELDTLLQQTSFAQVPDRFEQHVMMKIDALPETHSSQPTWWQWLALVGGGIPALMQIAGLVFSAWNIANAG